MKARAVVGAAALLALLTPHAGATEAAPYAPSAVELFDAGSGYFLLAWAPGSVQADFFNVYGVQNNGVPTLLGSYHSGIPVQVPAGYGLYGVSGVVDSVESKIIFPKQVCTHLSILPPAAGIDECTKEAGIKASVQHARALDGIVSGP
jgi:hypothetical protein